MSRRRRWHQRAAPAVVRLASPAVDAGPPPQAEHIDVIAREIAGSTMWCGLPEVLAARRSQRS